jgi:predicted Rossmann fold flavoprotein
MGATAFGYELARQFGMAMVEPRAGLVPLVFGVDDREQWCDLAGVSAEVVASAKQTPIPFGNDSKRDRSRAPKSAFREKLLVTHRGVSGPAVLQISSFWKPGGEVSFDLAPGREVLAPLLARTDGRDWNTTFAALREVLPTRMAERWVRVRANASAGDWTNAGIARLEAQLHSWTIRPDGSEGFAKAEVTVGGVDTTELDARSMESKRVPGLYFIGEVVDVTGWLGGYNFQWAWASGVAAGREA